MSSHRFLGLVATLVLTSLGLWGQTEIVLYNFAGTDGSRPTAGSTFDSKGNLYGTTWWGGAYGCGAVFELTRINGKWTENVLYSFIGGSDGCQPFGGLTFDAFGNLYGTALSGGAGGYGVVFELTPSNGTWTQTVLYSFKTYSDGANPEAAVIFDSAGNLYGTTYSGGTSGCGTVYELTPSQGGWSHSVLHSFMSFDGCRSQGGVILDGSDNLYGTTVNGGQSGYGTVFELTPSNGTWTRTVLYNFQGPDGGNPNAGLVMDNSGDLYGTTVNGGANGYGAVFELVRSNGAYTQAVLYSFTGGNDGQGPSGSLIFDSAGNLYGTAQAAGQNGAGTVFQLSPSNGTWSPNVLHSFAISDGRTPVAGLILDASGNLYGTTEYGGSSDVGVVFEITNGKQISTTTSITSSPNPSVFGVVTLTAQVIPTAGSGTPTGNVTFADSGTTLGTVSLSGGTAALLISTLPAGLNPLTASYGGDANYTPSVSPVFNQQVNQATSATTLSSSPNPSYVNQSVTLSATVTGQYGGIPTGSVMFQEGKTVLGTAGLVNAQAIFTTAFAAAGSYSIQAAYSGDPNYMPSASAPLVQPVISSGSLSFPWPAGGTPYTAPIFSAFDHNMQSSTGSYRVYGCDGTVTAYTGEVGKKVYGANAGSCLGHPGYAQDSQYTPFFVNSNYQGSGNGVGSSKGKPAVDFLNYDGHPGIDYGAPYGSTIVAAAPGVVHYPTYCMLAQTKANAKKGGAACLAAWQNDYIGGNPDEYNALELDPSNATGYKIFYLHLSTHPRTISLHLQASTTGHNFVAAQENAVPLATLSNCTKTPPVGNFSISGQVFSNGTGLGGVTVALIGDGVAPSGALQSINPKIATTDSHGNYSFTSLPPGYYHIEAAKNGYAFAAQNPNVLVQEGQTVSAGEEIALSGNSGNCIGPHLHFEVQEQTTPAQQKVVSYSYIPVDPYGWDGEDPKNPDPYPGITGGMQDSPLWIYSPFVTGFAPTSATANVSFPLTINGTGFDSGVVDCLILKGGNLQQCIQGTVQFRSWSQLVVQENLNSGTYFVRVENGDANKSNWKQLVVP